MTLTTLEPPPTRAPAAVGGADDAPGGDVVPDADAVPDEDAADLPRAARAVRWLRSRAGVPDAGMATAEYAVATVAAAGFAGLLLLILRSDEVRGLLLGIVRGALQV